MPVRFMTNGGTFRAVRFGAAHLNKLPFLDAASELIQEQALGHSRLSAYRRPSRVPHSASGLLDDQLNSLIMLSDQYSLQLSLPGSESRSKSRESLAR
jgi:hypothetical protein